MVGLLTDGISNQSQSQSSYPQATSYSPPQERQSRQMSVGADLRRLLLLPLPSALLQPATQGFRSRHVILVSDLLFYQRETGGADRRVTQM
jgi:hypothetical protein